LEKVRELEATQRLCIYNIQPVLGFSDAVDPELHIAYNWEGKNSVRQAAATGESIFNLYWDNYM
jgi:hypothetical protein